MNTKEKERVIAKKYKSDKNNKNEKLYNRFI
jgi:hypothetical protein